MRRVCVFCGSRAGNRPVYADLTRRLGAVLVQRGLELVYGAGQIGLMGLLADTVLQAGGRVVGAIPEALVDRELAHSGLTELHVVGSMHERKALMADLSDGFVALPGAYGTADELFEILTWAQLGMHAKPIGLLDVDGFFDPLLAWLDHTMTEGFMHERHRELLLKSSDPDEMLDLLLNYRAAPVTPKWIEEKDR